MCVDKQHAHCKNSFFPDNNVGYVSAIVSPGQALSSECERQLVLQAQPLLWALPWPCLWELLSAWST